MRQLILSGKKRKLTSFIEPFQQKVVLYWAPRVPRWIETYHLTLMTIPLSAAVVMFGYLARGSIWWLIGVAVCIFLQYVTDILDGAVGRYRKTGLVLWGFYMDHICDYIFANALVAAYTITYQLSSEFFIVSALVTSGIFVHEFLMCVASGELNTSGYYGFGPTEIRLLVLLMNFVLPFVPASTVILLMRGMLPLGFLVFVGLVYRAHRLLWKLDMEKRNR